MTMQDIFDVRLTRTALKQLKKVPVHVARKLQGWVDAVGHEGLYVVRKIPGYHDEPLKGNRSGQRSIRLSRSYRAIYTVEKGEIYFVEVIEVNQHDY
jgi:proteic killer suppression protein